MKKSLFKVFSMFVILALLFTAMPMQRVQAISTTIVISQFQVAGGTAADEFVELHNVGTTSFDLNGHRLVYRSAAGTTDVSLVAWTTSTIIPAGGYYLVAAAMSGTTPAGYDDTVTPDVTFTHSGTGSLAAAGGGLALRNGAANTGIIVDSVGFGTATNAFVETAVTTAPGGNTSKIRKGSSCQDTDNNSNDFDAANPSTPRNTASPVQPCGSAAEPVINEFSASTAGTDVEYVEIFGDPNTDYSAYKVLEIEGDSGTAAGTVDEVISLGTTDANGLYLVNLPANALENGSITLLLVKDFTGALNNDLDTNNDGMFETTPWDAIVDAVAVNDGGAGDVTYGLPVLGVAYDGLPFAPGGASRIPDGTDTDTAADWVRNDFDLAGIPGNDGTPIVGEAYNTPGALNQVVTPPAPQLVINEIDYDQPSTDTAEFVEIKNNGSSAVSLDGWTLELVNGNGGGAVIYDTIILPNVNLAAGDYFVVCANAATVPNCDLDDSPDTNFIQNGAPDAVGLRFNGDLMDAVSYEGDSGAPYTEGSGAGLVDDGSSATQSISRCADGSDTGVNNVDFALVEITPGGANACAVADNAPEVSGTFPVNGAADFPVGADLTVTFSEAVDVSGNWFELICSNSGTVVTSVSGGPTSFTLNPEADLVSGESCTLYIYAANVTDQDANDPPDNMEVNFTVNFTPFNACAATYTPIYDIQGSGSASPLNNTVVTTQAVVVGDFQGSTGHNGFYLQDASGDGDPLTSDGIFVFVPAANPFFSMDVVVGDVVRLTGRTIEFNTLTEIDNVTALTICGTTTPPAPTVVSLPETTNNDLERYEGMLITIPQTLTVSQNFFQGRYGQVTLSADGRLFNPTNLFEPLSPEAIALADENARRLLVLDDGRSSQNPNPIPYIGLDDTLRAGDTVSGITGVLDYGLITSDSITRDYRLQPTLTPTFTRVNERTTAPDPVGGNVKVASFNVLNYFNGDGLGGGFPTSRGADTLLEFNRQRDKIIAAIIAMDADVIGLMELENDAPPNSAIEDLVNGLNTATAPGTYSFINTGIVGTDEIRVAILYRTTNVTPVGVYALLTSAVDSRFIDTLNRPVVAQTFEENITGARFTVAVNHLKSKGSDCNAVGDPDIGDGQGNCNLTRKAAAEALVDWLATDPTGSGDPDFMIIGDLNSYALEDPITAILNAGYTDLIKSHLGNQAYSYIFDGLAGYLDHALATASLTSQVSGVTEWHINTDEPSVIDYNTEFKPQDLYEPTPYRSSDHDPVIVGLCLPPTGTASATPSILSPANHKYKDVSVEVLTSSNTDSITLVSVTSNEPDDGDDDGNTINDIVIVDDFNFKLRAERSGVGTGRIYTITYLVTNTCGATTTVTTTVTVPLNQGN
jgi:uncharacterized protein